jgi:hypothetical protein
LRAGLKRNLVRQGRGCSRRQVPQRSTYAWYLFDQGTMQVRDSLQALTDAPNILHRKKTRRQKRLHRTVCSIAARRTHTWATANKCWAGLDREVDRKWSDKRYPYAAGTANGWLRCGDPELRRQLCIAFINGKHFFDAHHSEAATFHLMNLKQGCVVAIKAKNEVGQYGFAGRTVTTAWAQLARPRGGFGFLRLLMTRRCRIMHCGC